MKIILITILLVACGKRATEEASVQPNPKIATLKSKYDDVKSKLKFDAATGWPSAADCDATLWAGLARAAGIDLVKIELAESKPGEIHRRPTPECFPAEAKSTVSRDMILGYIFASWRSKDLERLERLALYGERHNWIMGEGNLGQTLMTGNLIGLLGRSIEALGGAKKIYSVVPPIYSRDRADYVMHLTALYILLNGEIIEKLPKKVYNPSVRLNYPVEVSTTEISKDEKDLLKWLSTQDPRDLLFKTSYALYTGGNMDESIEGLMQQDYYVPPYVRGAENYKLVHWLFTAKLILGR